MDEQFEHIGQEGERVIRQMMEMEGIVKNSGWLDDSDDGLPTVDLKAVEPEIFQVASKWDTAVQNRHQQYLDKKYSHIPTHPTHRKNTSNHMLNGEVKIVDKVYLEKSYNLTNTEAASTVDMTVKEFNLNCDQEQAF